MALIPVFYTASTKDIAEKSHEQGILKYPGICWIQDIETIVYVSSDNELHYVKGNEQIDKVIGAVSGHLPTLNDDGSLVDSGKSVNDFETAGAAASVLADAKSYINKKISELINGAPETADTLKELSDLVSQNKDVITSLDTLVSKKADITAIPTTLPNPNALTFSGLIEGNYDGSEAVNIEVPQDMWIHVTTDSSNSLNSDVTFKEIENYYKSHPSNNIFICYKKDNAEFKGILETAYLGRKYEFGVWDLSLDYKIIKTVITIDQDDNISTTVVPSNISTVGTNRNTTFEKAVCELLVYNDCGIVDDAYNGDTYLVIKTHFDRDYGTCIISSSDTGFKAYTYNLRDMTIAPYTPNIISITIGGDGTYKSSYNFNTIKKINPENMLVCYNDAYGRLVSMDDNKVVFNIPKYVDNHLSIYMTIITINSDNSVEVIMEVPFARLLKNDNDAYVLDLSDTFMCDQFDIIYDAIQSSYLGKIYKETDDEAIFRIWLSETEIMDVTVNSNEINGATDLSAVPVTVEKKSIIPAALPNPNKLTFEGAVTAEYDGSSEVSVDIPNDYDSLENKPIVSINDLLNLDNEHFMCLDGKVNDKGMIPYRTYKFIVDPSLDLNNKLIVVTSDNNIKSMSLAVMAKDSAETTKVYATIFNLGIGELIAISTDKIHKTATVCRLSVGYRISLMFNDDGYVERTVVSSVANKSDVLTKTNKTEFIPTEDYHPATKKYVDDTCGEHSPTVRIEKTAADTTAEIEPNKLYVFPEMPSLTYTLATPSDTSIANEYHFVFRSGATATELVHPAIVSVPDGFAVEKNKVYEISILEGCLAYQSWAVSL